MQDQKDYTGLTLDALALLRTSLSEDQEGPVKMIAAMSQNEMADLLGPLLNVASIACVFAADIEPIEWCDLQIAAINAAGPDAN